MAASTTEPRRPRASIIILTYNQLDYTKLCVASVVRHTPQPYELILVDNASSDGTVAYLRTIAGAKLVVNSENLGFAGGNNQGLKIATGDSVVLLNNDAIVTPGWLDGLLAPFEREPQIGFVGPRSNYVAGPQLLRDIPYTQLDQLDDFAVERARTYAGQGSVTGFIVGFCLALRRSVVERIGGLDTRFGSGNFEDNDYCLRALRAGWVGWIADDVFVHHYGHRTFIGAGIDWNASMKRNGRLFARKWGLPCDATSGMPDFSQMPRVLERGFDPDHDRFPLPEHVDFSGGQPAPEPSAAGQRLSPELEAYQTGVRRLADGGAARAVPFLERAVELGPAVADFHNALGAAYFESQRPAEALAAFRRAVALDPTNADIRANLADVHRQVPAVSAAPTPVAEPARVLVLGSYGTGTPTTVAYLVETLSEAATARVEQHWAARGEPSSTPSVRAATRLSLPSGCSHAAAIAALLDHVSLDSYDAVLIVEDPVVLAEQFVDRFLAEQRQQGFALAQPAIVPHSRAVLPLAARQLGVVGRETSFVAAQPVVSVARAALGALRAVLSGSANSTWPDGLGLASAVRSQGLRVGIIDAIVADCGIRPLPSAPSATPVSEESSAALRVLDIVPVAA